jgi:hypothetical protein
VTEAVVVSAAAVAPAAAAAAVVEAQAAAGTAVALAPEFGLGSKYVRLPVIQEERAPGQETRAAQMAAKAERQQAAVHC